MTMPSSVDADALQMAAGMLPRAMAVKAMADCTVAGSAHRNSTPRYRSGVTSRCNTGRSTQPSNGNSTNVLATTTRCSRQCDRPATMAWRDSLAPCRKNSSPTAATVSPSKKRATPPAAGSTLASATVVSSARVKLSGRKRERAMAAGAKRGKAPIEAQPSPQEKSISLMVL